MLRTATRCCRKLAEPIRLSDLPSEDNTIRFSETPSNDDPIRLSDLEANTNGTTKTLGITGEIGPIKGFWNNLRFPWHTMDEFKGGFMKGPVTEEGMASNFVRWIMGNTTAMQEEEKYGLKEKTEEPSISLSDMKDAFDTDPGAFTAEFMNALMADPEFALTPIGWRGAAIKTAAALRTTSAIKKTLAANVAGAAGAATVGGGIAIPLSVLDQVDKKGDVDWGRVGEETLIASGLSVMFGAIGAKKFSAEKATEIVESTIGSAQVQAVAQSPVAEAVAAALEGVRQSPIGQLTRFAVDKTGGKSITRLDDAARYSETLRKIRNDFEYKEFSKEAIAPSYYQRMYTRMGEFQTRLQDIVDKTRTPFLGRITKKSNKEITDGLRGIGKATKVSKAMRQLLDDVRIYAKEAGLDIGELPNYFPRIYNIRRLKKDSDGFIKALTDNGIDAGAAHNIYRRIIEKEGYLDGAREIQRMGLDGIKIRKAKNLENSRVLEKVPDEALEPFLENGAYPVIGRYIISAVKRAEFSRTFGAQGEKLNSNIKKSMREMEFSGRPMRKNELRRIYDIADAIQGTWKPMDIPVVAKASKIIATYQLIRTLPLATISSLSEPFVILSRGRWDSALKALPKLVSHTTAGMIRSVVKKFPKPESTRAVERIGIALDDSVAEVLTQTFGGETNRVTTAFFKVTMLSQWTRMNRVWGYHAGRNMAIDNLKDIAKGSGFRLAAKADELAELGVPVDAGLAWIKKGMPDDEFTKTLDMAGQRFALEVVMTPRVTNRPMWHSNPTVHLLAQLKGFNTVFGNTVTKRWIKKILEDPIYQGPKLAATGSIMIMTAMIANDFRDHIKGTDRKPESDQKRLIRAWDRTGLSGVGQLALDAIYAHRFGGAGVSQLLGPFISQVDAIIEAIGRAAEGKPAKLKTEVANAIPIVNTKKEWRDAVKEQMN